MFVSSTLKELSDERLAVQRAIETLRLTPVMFELGARPHPPRALYRAYLEQSHVFLGIYWQSYGWVAPDEEISGLEDEYRLSGGPSPARLHQGAGTGTAGRLAVLLQTHRGGRPGVVHGSFASAEELEQTRQGRPDGPPHRTVRGHRRATPSRERTRRPLTAPPVPVTPTVGRDPAITEVQRLLADGCRSSPSSGPAAWARAGWHWKSCRHPMPAFPDGVAFVPLETVAEPSDASGCSLTRSEPPRRATGRPSTSRSII